MPVDLDSQLVREALQARLLVELMGNAMHKELVLKGGLAMRAVHGSKRHTKDIDLDADDAHPRARIHGIVVRSIQDALGAGLIDDAKVTEPKQTDTTMRWKIGGTVPGSDTPINLTVEVSRRPMLHPDHVIAVPLTDDFAPGAGGATVRVLDSQAIAVTKVIAMTEPRRVAPRDMYDLFVLIQADVTPPIALLASLPKERLEEALLELWPKIESFDYRLFREEVLAVMPKDLADAFTEEHFETMRLTVGERVQSWLQDARAMQEGGGPPSLGGQLLSGATRPSQDTAPAAKTASKRTLQ